MDKNDHVESDNKLAEWWMGSRHKIKEELENHLASVKDEHVRNHIRDNFHHRWDVMNDWAEDASRFGAENLGSPHESDFYGDAKLIPSNRPKNPRINAIINKLPADQPLDAVHSLIEHVNERRGKITPNQKYAIEGAVQHHVDKMGINDLIKVINKSGDPVYNNDKVKPLNVWIKAAHRILLDSPNEDKAKFLDYYNNLEDGAQKDKLGWWAQSIKSRME